MTRFLTVLTFGLIPILVSLASPAVGAEIPLDAPILEDWAREERLITVARDADGMSFTSARSSKLGMDEIRGEFSTASLEFQHLFVSTEPGNATVISYRLQFTSLVEFEDVDQDGRLDLGEPIVKRTPLGGHQGTTLELAERPHGSHVATIHVPLNTTNGSGILPVSDDQQPPVPVFELEILMTPRILDRAGRETLPTEVPFDWRLENFQPQRNDSLVALELRARSTVEFDPEVNELAAVERAFASSYSWNPDVLVDGRRQPVMASIVEAPGGALAGEDVGVFLAHEPGERIEGGSALAAHRYGTPVATLPGLLAGLPKGDGVTYLTGLALTGILVGSFAFVRTRRGP